MFETGLLAGLTAKLAGLGTVAKAAIATTTAAVTMTVAGATGALPLGADSAPVATQSVIDHTAGAADQGAPSGAPNAQAGGEASVVTPDASGSASADVGAATESPASSIVPVPDDLPIPPGTLPDLSGLTQLPSQVMSCLTPVLSLVTAPATVSPGQIAQIGPGIVSCVTGVVQNVPLPFGLNACLSEIMGFVGGIVSQLPAGTPDVGDLDVSVCIPTGLPVPTGMFAGLPFMQGGFGFNR